MEFAELTGKEKLVFDACIKIHMGTKYYEEGVLELKHLIEGALTKPAKRKAAKSTFRVDKRNDEDVAKKIVDVLKKKPGMPRERLRKAAHLGARRFDRILEGLVAAGKVRDSSDSKFSKWVVSNFKASPKSAPVTANKIIRHSTAVIDVTDQKLVDKAVSFLKTNDWVNKGKLIEAVNISTNPANRLFEYMQKNKIIKLVRKKNNPSHKHMHKMYNQTLPYWELV